MQDRILPVETAMHPLLKETLEEIESATAGMTESQLKYQPEGKWSAAQVLEHLSLTYEHTVKGANKVLTAGRNLGDQPSMIQRMMQMVVLDLKHFPRGRKSPEMVVPQGAMGGLEAVTRIRENLMAMDQRLAECREKIGTDGRVMNHPVLGPLSNEQWCVFHCVHAKHHMKQIRALRDAQQAQGAQA